MISKGNDVTARTWTGGDNEPDDLPQVIDAYGDTWWCASNERHPGDHDGWRSDQMGYFDEAKTWWWLSMYRSPLREDETTR